MNPFEYKIRKLVSKAQWDELNQTKRSYEEWEGIYAALRKDMEDEINSDNDY